MAHTSLVCPRSRLPYTPDAMQLTRPNQPGRRAAVHTTQGVQLQPPTIDNSLPTTARSVHSCKPAKPGAMTLLLASPLSPNHPCCSHAQLPDKTHSSPPHTRNMNMTQKKHEEVSCQQAAIGNVGSVLSVLPVVLLALQGVRTETEGHSTHSVPTTQQGHRKGHKADAQPTPNPQQRKVGCMHANTGQDPARQRNPLTCKHS